MKKIKEVTRLEKTFILYVRACIKMNIDFILRQLNFYCAISDRHFRLLCDSMKWDVESDFGDLGYG